MRLWNSLFVRLVLLSGGVTLAALVISANILTSLYRDAALRDLDARLLNISSSIVATGLDASALEMLADNRSAFSEPLFFQPASGWYWWLDDVSSQTVVASSPSYLDPIALLPGTAAELGPDTPQVFVELPAVNEQPSLRVLLRRLQTDDGTFHLAISGNMSAVITRIAEFRSATVLTLATFGLMLIMGMIAMVWLALRPVNRLRQDLSAMRSGNADQLSPTGIEELQPLADDINRLVSENKRVVERARNETGNLAHALKTPLSVMLNELRKSSSTADASIQSHVLLEQSEKMQSQIAHALERARMVARAQASRKSIELEPLVQMHVRVMKTLHADRQLAFDVEVAADLHVVVDEEDLTEIIGNLLDNASRFAASKIEVKAAHISVGDRPHIRIIVADDGEGMSKEQRAQAIKRGTKLDETRSQTGLGLAIVYDTVTAYGGTFALQEASLGGLEAMVDLPDLTISTR